MEEQLLTAAQVAERLDVSRRQVYRLVKSGALRPIKYGHKTVRYRAGDLERPAGAALDRERVRGLVAEIRRYVIAHGLLIGECVAWDALKQLVDVGQEEGP